MNRKVHEKSPQNGVKYEENNIGVVPKCPAASMREKKRQKMSNSLKFLTNFRLAGMGWAGLGWPGRRAVWGGRFTSSYLW